MCIAIECSYKLDQKNELKFLCELCTFLQIRSHIMVKDFIKPLTIMIDMYMRANCEFEFDAKLFWRFIPQQLVI